MNTEKAPVTVWPKRFDPPTANPVLTNPPSPSFLQSLMQVTANCLQKMTVLEEKVDALGTRTHRGLTAAPAPPEPKALPEAAPEPNEAVEPKPTPRRRIDRSKLLEFFD
jgi:hypothetical protein